MTDDRSLERAARSWLENGPTEAPDRAVEAALLRIQTTPQERDLRIPWRFPKMTTPARVATAAVIGVLVVGGALFILGRPVSPTSAGPARRRHRLRPHRRLLSPGRCRAYRPARSGPPEAGQHMAKPFAPPNGNGAICPAGMQRTARDDTSRHVHRSRRLGSNDSGAAINKPATGWVAPQGMGLLFGRGGWLNSDPCIKVDLLPDIPVGPTVDDFANALADHPSSTLRLPRPFRSVDTAGNMWTSATVGYHRLHLGLLPLGALDARSGTKPQTASLDPRCRRHPRRGGNRGLRGNHSLRPGRASGDRGLDPDRTLTEH